ncbi:MAG: GLPGLI family protein [Flavobacterium sp.]|nr:GLPGLI family protein [Flavobacterium sp.]
MKTYLLFLLFTFSLVFSQSQNGEVTFSFFAYGVKKEAKLIFNNSQSIFTIKNDHLNKKKVEVIGREEENSNMNIDLYFNFDINTPKSFGMLTDIKNNCIIDHKFFPIDFAAIKFDTLFVKDKARIISWELLNETKKINSFNCQKARGNFRGRTYTVWFTNDIPVSLGPWKLNGLPGLILEATDSLNQFQFFAEKIELQMEVNTIDIRGFFNHTYITPIQERIIYVSFVELMFKEITTKIRSSMPRGVVSTTNNANAKVVDENNFIEINFDDIKKK